GSSISGWQADLPRYRELWRRTCEAVFRAREEAGVDVLVGGADSSSNTFDKLFSEGLDNSPFWPNYLDFCSMHYQGLSVPSLDASWRSDEHPLGRVLLWDTESWVANADDRFAGVVAACRAAGYDRVMGSHSRIAVSTLSHGRVAMDTIQTTDGTKRVPRVINARPLAAAYSAAQAFMGEREFDRILFQDALPYVFVFHGLDGDADDGTVVVLGDLDSLFHARNPGLLPLTGIDRLDADTPPTLVLRNDDGAFSAFDAYGNRKGDEGGSITVPLGTDAVYLRATPCHEDGFAKLIAALEAADLRGLEPLDIVVQDATDPIETGATFGVTLANQHARVVDVALTVAIGDLQLDYPEAFQLLPHEKRDIEVRVLAGTATPSNGYPMTVRAAVRATDSDGTTLDLGTASHAETVRVNRIARQSVTIDGDLADWAGSWPQAIDAGEEGQSLEEAMWTPFVPFESGSKPGRATAFLAYDDDAFYFAARIADSTPEPGTIRFDGRDEDADYYPEVAYKEIVPDPSDPPFSARWTGLLVPDETGIHEIAFRGDDGFRVWVGGEKIIDQWRRQHPTWGSARVQLEVGVPVPIRVEWFSEFGNAYAQLAWRPPGAGERTAIPAAVLRPTTDATTDQRGLTGAYYLGTNHDHAVMERVDQHVKFGWQAGVPEGFEFDVDALPRGELRWPDGVRRYSYRQRPLTPGSASQRPFDNVQIGFNVIEPGEDGWLASLPGRPARFPSYQTTDYAFALNRVAEDFGGGTEVFQIDAPRVPRQHGFPRQPRHKALGPVEGARLSVKHDDGTRTVEVAIPWSAMPEAHEAMLAGKPIKFSYRVNHGEGNFNMELARGRSAALGLSRSFHPDWNQSWPIELVFGWESSASGNGRSGGR
ncbi:MAG: PA14 domain-containing protein, partial [Planctomycetota bacterium]